MLIMDSISLFHFGTTVAIRLGCTRDKSLKCLKIAQTILSQNLSKTIEMLSFEVTL